MRKVNIHEAKTTLSQLVEAAESGETVVLARAGQPVVQLVRLKKKRGIKLGGLKGSIPEKLISDIARPLSKKELERLFGGGLDPVRVLLDTHMVLWALADSPRLTAKARALLADANNECWVSSASVWEIAIKVILGKYELGQPLDRLGEAIDEAGFRTLDVTVRHAAAIEHVKIAHADPFDRLLLAQCEVETLRLLTADKVLVNLPVAVAS